MPALCNICYDTLKIWWPMDSYDLREESGTYFLTLSGRFTYNHHSKVQELVKFFINSRAKKLVIDLGSLTFIDSAAVGMLLIIAQELKNMGGSVSLENPQGQVDRVLTTAKVYDVLLTPEYTSQMKSV